MRIPRTVAASAIAAAVAIGGSVTLAAPAQAAATTHCKTSSKNFDLPGKPDVKVSLNICIKYTGSSGGYRHYKAWVNKASWEGNSFYIGGKRFNDFSILMRAEHGSTKVENCNYGICEERSVSGEINDSNSGSKTFATGASGYGEAYVKTKSKNWTADATAYVDIADDGKGSKAWGLTGTSAVS
ncbi:hypothetical protein OIU91_41300 (plasmid) [Streptomyces sp. NBC_01456]|uniref:hypothetical protein n=1 Tax=unclassified Streptomyces TaxID=2593676 RepID=UPI002E312143|nr:MULTISPECIES: hypothetical protein [unclassified Streptomyces]